MTTISVTDMFTISWSEAPTVISTSVYWNQIRYRLYAPIYDQITKPLEHSRQRAMTQLDLESGEKLLIIGCGTGADLEYVPSGVDVTVLDVTPEMVRRTVGRATRLGHEVDSRVMDARSLPFEADEFHAVTLHLVLSVVPDPIQVVNEAARVLTSGGRISIVDKFLGVDEAPSLPRRLANPVARVLFSDLNRRLEPLLNSADLRIETQDQSLRGLYTVALARRDSTVG